MLHLLLPELCTHFRTYCKISTKYWFLTQCKPLTCLNKDSRPFFLGDNRIRSFPAFSSLSDYSFRRSWRLFYILALRSQHFEHPSSLSQIPWSLKIVLWKGLWGGPDLGKALSWEFPNPVVSDLVVCNFYAGALLCALLRPFALFCALSRSFASFALIRALLHTFLRPTAFRGTAFGNCGLIRKILVSVKFLSAILGPEMAAPILWTPGKNAFFLQENLCP